MPYLASVEVDQRQTFIHQADTLQEIVGASKLISYSVKLGRDISAKHPGVEVVWPVSGVLRLLGNNRDELAHCVAELRDAIEADGLAVSASLIERTADYDADLFDLERRVRKWKDSKTGAVAVPTLPYFAPCGIQPQLYAQHWRESCQAGRRELLSWQSKTRRDRRNERDPEFYWGLHMDEFAIPEDFDDLVISESDSYIALIKADVDGLGRLLSDLRFESVKKHRNDTAENIGREFTEHLWVMLRSSVQEAFNQLYTRTKNACYPFRPLVVAGDDLLILSQRHLALELAAGIAHDYAVRAAQDSFLQEAFAACGLTRDEPVTLSCGVLFLKKGFPFDAAAEMAEDLVRSAKDYRRSLAFKEGCVDFHWLASSGRERITDCRCAGERYVDSNGIENALYTRPWTLSAVGPFVEAARMLADFPRRKLKQLDTIVRLDGSLAELAYEQWWSGLTSSERSDFSRAFGVIEWPAGSGRPDLWRGRNDFREASLLEIELLRQILKEQ
jgi:hypothetical protein